jgi:Asp-tRNA(Asn)/Glu-tRNA(Gln) amidotransferase B subunit
MVDISAIGCTLNASISFLKRHFLYSPYPNLGQFTKHLRPFLSNGWVDGPLRWGTSKWPQKYITPCTIEGFLIELTVWTNA